MAEVLTHTADGARVGLDGFGLQALELQMLQKAVVMRIKLGSVSERPVWQWVWQSCGVLTVGGNVTSCRTDEVPVKK